MGRSSTTFTKGDPRAVEARLKHGAKSDTVVGDRARRTYRALCLLVPRLSKRQRVVLRLLASVRTKRELLDEHFDRSGLFDGKALDGAAAFYGEMVRMELSLMERLKLTEAPEESLAAKLRRYQG
jgi:hypothetical protein